jgi:hypothetical protein
MLLAQRTVRPTARDGQRGRPGPDTPPVPVVYTSAGARASRVAVRQALGDHHRGFLLATYARDDAQLPPQERLAGDTGQGHAARGCRFLKAPRLLASSVYLQKPARIMALVLVMTVCRLVYAALAYRLRQALKDQGRPFPHQQGPPVQTPTAWGVLHYGVGSQVRLIPGPWTVVLHLTVGHQQRLTRLGKPSARFYRCICTKMNAAVRNVGWQCLLRNKSRCRWGGAAAWWVSAVKRLLSSWPLPGLQIE